VNTPVPNPFTLPGLDEARVPADPLELFARWYTDAAATDLLEPAAMALATATPDGAPSARIVLLRGFDERGFAFYTNYQSRKADELAANPRAALVIHWDPLRRQVRIEGTVAKVSAAESDAYFRERPVGHQLSALASPQSRVILGRRILDENMERVCAQFKGAQVPRPDSWGGYRLTPHTLEFWQGRENRLHDRLRYRRHEDAWVIERLAP